MSDDTARKKALEDLERIDDRICDLYSGQDHSYVFKEMTEEGRERLRNDLFEIYTALRAWGAENSYDYMDFNS